MFLAAHIFIILFIGSYRSQIIINILIPMGGILSLEQRGKMIPGNTTKVQRYGRLFQILVWIQTALCQMEKEMPSLFLLALLIVVSRINKDVWMMMLTGLPHTLKNRLHIGYRKIHWMQSTTRFDIFAQTITGINGLGGIGLTTA